LYDEEFRLCEWITVHDEQKYQEKLLSSSVPFVDIISPTLKKQILEDRGINLAALLMKDYESVQAASSLHTAADLKLICQDARLHTSFCERICIRIWQIQTRFMQDVLSTERGIGFLSRKHSADRGELRRNIL